LNSDTFRLPKEALTHLREKMAGAEPYSLAIIDHCMPEMGGFEAAAEIRRIAADLPIVMLSSEANPGDAARRVEAGLAAMRSSRWREPSYFASFPMPLRRERTLHNFRPEASVSK